MDRRTLKPFMCADLSGTLGNSDMGTAYSRNSGYIQTAQHFME